MSEQAHLDRLPFIRQSRDLGFTLDRVRTLRPRLLKSECAFSSDRLTDLRQHCWSVRSFNQKYQARAKARHDALRWSPFPRGYGPS